MAEDMIILVVVDEKNGKATGTDQELLSSVLEGSSETDDNIKKEENIGVEIKVETLSDDDHDYLGNMKSEMTEDEEVKDARSDHRQIAVTLLKGLEGGLEPGTQESSEYLDDIKDEHIVDDANDDNNITYTYNYEDEDNYPINDFHEESVLPDNEQRSFVDELRQRYKKLRDNEDLLIENLMHIMKNLKSPEMPQDYYVIKDDKYKCIHCDRITGSKSGANRHYKERHGPRYLVCFACGLNFRSTTNLYKHEKRCKSSDARIVLAARDAAINYKGARKRPQLSTDPYKFRCELCSAAFVSKIGLRSHQNLHRGERPFRCHICPCAYTSYAGLYRHIRTHSNVQYVCDHCSRAFKQRGALVAHMDTHLPIRKHACPECGRRFVRKAPLMLHIDKVHKKLPSPCACEICPKRYPRNSLLKAHMKREHGMSLITRTMFLKSLPAMSEVDIQQSMVFKRDHTYSCDAEHSAEENQELKREDDNETKQDAFIVPDYGFPYVEDDETSKDGVMQDTTDWPEVDGSIVYVKNGEVVKIIRDGRR